MYAHHVETDMDEEYEINWIECWNILCEGGGKA